MYQFNIICTTYFTVSLGYNNVPKNVQRHVFFCITVNVKIEPKGTTPLTEKV